MVFDCISIFVEMFASLSNFGITQRAKQQGLWQLHLWDPRDFTVDAYRRIDDRPFGGGPGMVMLAEPLAAAVNAAKERQIKSLGYAGKVVYLSPQGQKLNEQLVGEWSSKSNAAYILLCGRYEGIDQRFIDNYVDYEISLGDFVVSGGELPAMILMDSLIRRLPGVLSDAKSAIEDSFVNGLLDCPQYTRPYEWQGQKVPDVLMSGHHENIRRWRLEQSLQRTRERRPDLIAAWQTR